MEEQTKMTEQEKLGKGIGNIENETLKPAKVKITEVKIKETPKSEIVEIICKHPDREEPIHITSAKIERNGKLEIANLWYNLDTDNNLKKSSAVAIVLNHVAVPSILELVNKELDTVADDNGYLVLRAY